MNDDIDYNDDDVDDNDDDDSDDNDEDLPGRPRWVLHLVKLLRCSTDLTIIDIRKSFIVFVVIVSSSLSFLRRYHQYSITLLTD